MRSGYPVYATSGSCTISPWMLLASSFAILAVSVGYLISEPGVSEAWVHFWGFRPDEIMAALTEPLADQRTLALIGLFTALFLHADWVHLIGNLAYLWVFGISVERAVGHWIFLIVFIGLGALANGFTAWQLQELQNVAVIGASGGVSAIIGVYLGLFPRRRMGLWLPLGLYLQFARVPAILVIGSWFTLQLLYSVFGPESHAVAWSAHVAGFGFGLAAAVLLRLMPSFVNLHYRDD